MEERKKHSNLPLILLIAGVAVLAVAMILVGVFFGAYRRSLALPDTVQEKLDMMPDLNAQEGTAQQVDTPADQDNFRIIINQMVTMEQGDDPCVIEAENPTENAYDLRVCLYDKETNELLGATHRIERGKMVESIDLNETLSAGEHPVLAVLELFDDNQEPVTQLTVDMVIQVLQ